MDHQHMRNIIRRENEEMWHEGRVDASHRSSHAHRVTHTAMFGDVAGHEAHGGMVQMFNAAFSDHHMRIDHLVVEGDHAAYRIIHRVKHTGTFMGIEPTGKEVTVAMANFARFEGDKIAELWTIWDSLVLFKQLGVDMPVGSKT